MQYYGLKSIIGSQKQEIPLRSQTDSFFLKEDAVNPYIEPTFTKEEFPREKPAILLVSAVGASGKTTTAQSLSHDTNLPILDLAKHKPVGDNTLTGIITTAFPIDRVGAVLEGLSQGTYGIIIDGIDEGRSKTTEQAFEAFLDDLAVRSQGAESTSIVVFGRSQVLINTWLYLEEKGADVGLIQIDPFNLDQAKNYIDSYVTEKNQGQIAAYQAARDEVLGRLSAAFDPTDGEDGFLSFIGYPPVLDAIATLLREEKNYHRISQTLNDSAGSNLEVSLLVRIADFLLKRERDEKALPNFINELLSKADTGYGNGLRETLYNNDEQCARIIARALQQEFPLQLISDSALNEEYNKHLSTWCPEHPFLLENRIRNAVFAAVAVSRCVVSDVPEYQQLAKEYTEKYPPTYHLIYIMQHFAASKKIGVGVYNMLIQSCSDFVGKGHDIRAEVSGISWDEPEISEHSSAQLEVTVAIQNGSLEKSFEFEGVVSVDDVLSIGPHLENVVVSLPCDVELKGAQTVDSVGFSQIVARSAKFDSTTLIVRGATTSGATEQGLFLDVERATGHVAEVTQKGAIIEIGCSEHTLTYPLAKYVKKTERGTTDPVLAEKFRRLRRIMQEFVSHSKGGLAKYRAKIEHERVLRGEIGQKVLAQLLEEKVLSADPKFYYVDSDKLADVLGTTWHELRQHKMSKSAENFLKRIN
ncbi:hypothetical protein AB1L42_15295 [Thalassoglobus sp. JC818]|uniref:hypothetical protein n=1 Tax=Thalassoglobus sp. JC818 TaxID=3232136 RepID=UPI0034578447